jgi:hypothetical protein
MKLHMCKTPGNLETKLSTMLPNILFLAFFLTAGKCICKMQTPGNPLVYFFLNMNSKEKSSYATNPDNLTSTTRSNHLGDSSSTIVKISTLLLNFRGIIVFFQTCTPIWQMYFFLHRKMQCAVPIPLSGCPRL